MLLLCDRAFQQYKISAGIQESVALSPLQPVVWFRRTSISLTETFKAHWIHHVSTPPCPIQQFHNSIPTESTAERRIRGGRAYSHSACFSRQTIHHVGGALFLQKRLVIVSRSNTYTRMGPHAGLRGLFLTARQSSFPDGGVLWSPQRYLCECSVRK